MMKILLPIIELILYILIFIFIDIYLHKQLIKKLNNQSFFIIVIFDLIGIFPIIAGIDYFLKLQLPILEECAAFGFIIGGFYIYFALFDLIYLFIRFIINFFLKDSQKNIFKSFKIKIISLSIISFLSLATCSFGYACTQNPVVSKFNINQNNLNIKIAAVSDLHYGTTCSTINTTKLVKQINEIHPDIVLLLGDIFDNNIDRLNKDRFTKFVNGFTSTYGTYAILGNHEIVQNGINKAASFYNQSQVNLLLNEEVIINNAFRLVGRIDYIGKNENLRIPLNSFVSSSSLPLIVLDHQPITYKESFQVGAFLQLSGHTHNGQLIPYNYILKLYYKLFYNTITEGLASYYNNSFYLVVSRGYGNWGFPYRTSGQSQICLINI